MQPLPCCHKPVSTLVLVIAGAAQRALREGSGRSADERLEARPPTLRWRPRGRLRHVLPACRNDRWLSDKQ